MRVTRLGTRLDYGGQTLFRALCLCSCSLGLAFVGLPGPAFVRFRVCLLVVSLSVCRFDCTGFSLRPFLSLGRRDVKILLELATCGT